MSEEKGDWLQLTEEDLERAQRLAREHPPMPGVIQLTEADVEEAAPEDKGAEAGVIQIEVEPEAGSAEAAAPEPEPPPGRSPIYTAAPLTITPDDLVPAGPQTERSDRVRELEELLFRLVNEARAQHLPGWLRNQQLSWHDGLAAVARGHSVDMIKRHYVEHRTPEGAGAADRIGVYQIRFLACGENIGVVYGENSHTVQGAHDIHNAFMNQPRGLSNHRGNILNPIWTHVGIGVSYNPDGALVATQNFISTINSRG